MTGKWKVSLEATAFRADQFPPPDLPECAVAGRSNVGKSSLVNALLGGRLAHVGSTPGKTRSVNFFLVESPEISFRLVDLPGYGYASRSKGERRQWSQLIDSYVAKRPSLKLTLHLCDFRHGLLANDEALQEWLVALGLPVLVVFTKGDKISRGARRGTLHKYIRAGLKSVDVPIITSAEKKEGIGDLRAFLVNFMAGEKDFSAEEEQI